MLARCSARIEVSQAAHPFGQAGSVDVPMLKTSEITLTAGSTGDTNTDAPYFFML